MKKNVKILVTVPFNEKQNEKIKSAAGENAVVFCKGKNPAQAEIEEAEVIIGNLSVENVKSAKNLKLLQLNSAGANGYCDPGVLADGAVLCNVSGAYDISVSEYMVAYTLAIMKKVPSYLENQKQHSWSDEGEVSSPYGACVVVLGLGNIGLNYARRMKAMGSYIIGVKRTHCEAPEGVDEICTLDQLEDCLKRADVVANILPGTEETCHILGKKQFEIMKKTAYVINAGRGNAIQCEELAEALHAGEIAGAVIDVTEPEPLPENHPLWDAPNLMLTPHVAGGFHLPITLEIISEICADNLHRYLNDEPLTHIVNRTLGY